MDYNFNNREDIQKNYPMLSEFFYSFLNEPYSGEETIQECIDNFLYRDIPGRMSRSDGFYSTDPKVFKAILDDLNKLITENHKEDETEKIIGALGMHLGIEDGDGWGATSHTYSEWIKDLRDILQKEYDKRFNK